MFNGCYSGLEVVTIGVGGATVFIFANWLSNGSLRKGRGKRDALNDSASDWVVRSSGMNFSKH